MSSWRKNKYVYWETSEYHNYSFVFSWNLYNWLKNIQPELDNKKIKVGGPAVYLNIDKIPNWIEIGYNENVLYRHNNLATKTSIGCIRKCKFCAVPTLEGDLKELNNYEIKPIVIDNNLLACSRKHFDNVIDNLKKIDWCDFNQGLDARLLTKHHALRFAELKKAKIRLAWDNIKNENSFFKAYDTLKKAGIKNYNLSCYVLIGFKDTPEDALYRLEILKKKKIEMFPMRYQPINTIKKNSYVSHNWTDRLLKDYMRYWSNLRFFSKVPFNEYDLKRGKK